MPNSLQTCHVHMVHYFSNVHVLLFFKELYNATNMVFNTLEENV